MAAITTYGTDGLLSSTIAHYIPTLEDNVFTSKPLLWALKEAGRIKNFTGTKIVVPLMYAEAPNVGTYADDDVFGTAANTGLSAAEYAFKQFYGLVHFTGIELAKNSGKEAVLSLLENRLLQLEMSIAENLNEELWTGDGTTGNQWLGVEQIAGDVDTTVGDINSTDYAWWDPQVDNTNAALTLARMRTIYNSCSEGNDHPTNIFTTQTGFEKYEDFVDEYARFLDPKMADAGFQNLMFKGAPITFDSYAISDHMFFLNMKYLTLAKLANVWFEQSDWLRPTNADVQYKHIRLYGNLVVSNRSRQGCIGDMTA